MRRTCGGVRSSRSIGVRSATRHASTVSEVEGQLVKLRELYDAGLFTDAEYDAKRTDLLGRM
jgi:hypothetical protein